MFLYVGMTVFVAAEGCTLCVHVHEPVVCVCVVYCALDLEYFYGVYVEQGFALVVLCMYACNI